jgi:hypothetical protein
MVHTSKFFKTLMFALPMATSIGMINLPLGAQAIPDIWTSVNYKPPAGIGRPGNTEGGATRGNDLENLLNSSVQREVTDDLGKTKLLAIVPPNQYGVTLQAYPEVFVYVGAPDSFAINPVEVEFSVEDGDNNPIYSSSFKIDAYNQVIKLGIPEQAGIAPLKVGDVYKWSLTSYDSLDFDTSQVGGILSRVPMRSDLKLDLTTDWTIAKSYAQGEVWYDAIATLAGVYQENHLDQGVAVDLNNLLKSVGLEIKADNFPSSTQAASL